MISGGVSASRSASIPAPPLSFVRGTTWHCYSCRQFSGHRYSARAGPDAESRRSCDADGTHANSCPATPGRLRLVGTAWQDQAACSTRTCTSTRGSPAPAAKTAEIGNLAWWAARKGLSVIGTGDFTHPAWAAQLAELLVPAEPGLLALKPELSARLRRTLPPSCQAEIRFLLSTEISTIYKRDDATRKVHHLLYAPTFEAASAITTALAKVGNLASEGRPILGLDSRHLLEITLNAGPGVLPHPCPHLDAVVRRSWVEVRVRRRTRLLPRPSRTCLRRGDGAVLGPADELDLLRT